MATFTPSNRPKYKVQSHAQETGITTITFTGNGSSDPVATTIVDPGEIVSTITRDAANSLKITLKTKFTYVRAFAQARLATDTYVNCDAVTEGASAASVINLTPIVSGSASDTTAVVDVIVWYSTRAVPA